MMKSINPFASSVNESFLFTTKNGLEIGYLLATTLSSLALTPFIFKSFNVLSKYPNDMYPIEFLLPSTVDLTFPEPSHI